MHPNRVPFSGVLALLDVRSDTAPALVHKPGQPRHEGRPVVLTRAAAENALPTLIGMAVNCKAGWDHHDTQRKVGVIAEASIVGNALHVRGYIYGYHFPDVVRDMRARNDLGMSYELADAHVIDIEAPVWTLTRVIFTGAAILLRKKAAYVNTSFRLETECLSLK
jgi:hypothetical protein